MPDDHSEVVPLLPIPNRTVKRLCADDSAGSRVKVGHRQAVIAGRPVYGRGVLISTSQVGSVDGSVLSALSCESSPTSVGKLRSMLYESAKTAEFDRAHLNLS